MAVGVSTTLANNWLNAYRGGAAGTSITAPSALYVQLHTGNPGTAGTSLPSGNTTRPAITFGAASSGAFSLSNSPSWTSWPSGQNNEVITNISVWDASTSGNFLFSAQLSTSKTMTTGDTLTISTCSVTFTTAS